GGAPHRGQRRCSRHPRDSPGGSGRRRPKTGGDAGRSAPQWLEPAGGRATHSRRSRSGASRGRPFGGDRGRVSTPATPRLVLGQQAVREAIRAHGPRLGQVLIEERPGPRTAAIERFARDQGVPITRVPRAELERLSKGTLHQGVAAWAPPLSLLPAEELWNRSDLLAVALDGIVDPQNFGAVIRSAVALGPCPVVFPENASAPLTPATFRASAGAIEHASLVRVPSLPSLLREAAARGVSVLGLAPEANRFLHEVDLTGPTLLT